MASTTKWAFRRRQTFVLPSSAGRDGLETAAQTRTLETDRTD